jgi:chemotaxis protein CheX
VKNILVLSHEKQWKIALASTIKEQFKATELQLHYVSNRSEALSEITQSQYELFLISSGIPKKDIEYIFRYISTNENINLNMNIFFISEDFEQFSEILKFTNFPKIHLFSAPIDFGELAKRIRQTLFPISKHEEADKILKINLEFLKTFVDSTKYIFEAFCNLKDVKHQKPLLLNDTNRKTYDLEGSIELQSDLFHGIFYVCFTKSIYLKIIEHVLMEKPEEINENNIDFIAEIVNMIYGQAKIALNQSGHNFKKVIPQFMQDPAPLITKNIVTIVPIDTELGTIDIKIELIKKSNN